MSNSAWATGSTPTLASKIDTLTIQAAEQLGSGYRPTAWCVNQGCHVPLPVGTAVCPECNTQQQPKPASKCRDCQTPISTGLICTSCLERRR